MRRITLVKKIKADGKPCRKCVDIVGRLEKEGLMSAIDRVVIADERLSDSEGLRLARRHGVDRAPFFIVEDDASRAEVYTVYCTFARDVLRANASERDEIQEILDQNPDLGFL